MVENIHRNPQQNLGNSKVKSIELIDIPSYYIAHENLSLQKIYAKWGLPRAYNPDSTPLFRVIKIQRFKSQRSSHTRGLFLSYRIRN